MALSALQRVLADQHLRLSPETDTDFPRLHQFEASAADRHKYFFGLHTDDGLTRGGSKVAELLFAALADGEFDFGVVEAASAEFDAHEAVDIAEQQGQYSHFVLLTVGDTFFGPRQVLADFLVVSLLVAEQNVDYSRAAFQGR